LFIIGATPTRNFYLIFVVLGDSQHNVSRTQVTHNICHLPTIATQFARYFTR